MRARIRFIAPLAVLVALTAACGDSGSSGTGGDSDSTAAAGDTCAPVAGDQLVVLEDDQELQTVDNIIPAVNALASSDAMLEALNGVSDVLDTDTLISLNKQTDVDRETSPNVAKQFVEDEGLAEGLSGGSGKVVVGHANFSENATLANIYAEVLNAAGFDASVRQLSNREVIEPALEKGDVDVVPEYVGTLTEFINKAENGADAEPIASPDLDKTVEGLTGLGEKVGLTFGEPSEAQDQNSFAVTTAFADEHGVETLSDLAEECGSGLVLGGPPECPERPFCQPGLEDTYGLVFDNFTSLDAGGPLSKTALKQGKVALALVFSSDAALASS